MKGLSLKGLGGYMDTALGLLIMRLGFGLTMFVRHGLPKVLDFSKKMGTFPDPFGIGSASSLSLTVFAEGLCAFLIIIGLFTRFAAIPLVITMAVATFMIHSADAFKVKELALLYLIAFSAIFCCGPGPYSADAIFRKVK